MSTGFNQSFFNSLGGYQPLGGNLPAYPSTGFENIPFGSNPMLQLFAPPALQGMMGSTGMSPFGFTGRNAYSVMLARQFENRQNEMMSRMAAVEQQNYFRTLQGLAAISGTPFGHDQRMAASNIAGVFASASPLLSQIAPEFLDQLSGGRGSPLVLGNRMMLGGRYRLDPITGSLGMSQGSSEQLVESVYRDMYESGSLSDMQGVSAGQLGGLFQELQSRGMIQVDNRSAADRGREMVQRLRQRDSGQLISLAARTGVSLDSLTSGVPISDSDMASILQDDSMQGRLRGQDAERVKRSLQSYVDSIAAVREIFGDAGQPNAPMQQLVAGLERLTQGGLSQLDPQRIAQLVRMTGELSQLTGTSIGTIADMQTHAANRASQLGLSPAFAVESVQGSLAFGAALRSRGYGAQTGYGLMSVDQMQQADLNLRVQAADSSAANQMALAFRIRDQVGIDDGSDAARYIRAIESGQTAFVDQNGRTRSVDLTRTQFDEMFRAANAGLTPQVINSLRGQKFSNQAYLDGSMIDVARRLQTSSDFQPFVRRRVEDTLRNQLTSVGFDPEDAVGIVTRLSPEIADSIFNLDQETVADPGRFSIAVSEIFQRSLEAQLGDRLTRALASQGIDASGFFRASGTSFQGYANRVLRRTPGLENLGTINNLIRLNQGEVFDAAGRISSQAKIRASLRQSLSAVGSGGPIRAVVDAVIDADPSDPDALSRVVSSAFGGIDKESLSRELVPQLQQLQSLEREYQQQANAYDSSGNMEQRKAAMSRLNELQQEIRSQAEGIRNVADELGIETDQTLTNRDFVPTINATSAAAELSDRAFTSPIARRRMLESGELGDAAMSAMSLSEDLAFKTLLSDSAVRQLGPDGLELASGIRDANADIYALAAKYTGGDVERLLAGDFQGSDEVRAEIANALSRRNQYTSSLRSMYDSNRRFVGTEAQLSELGIKSTAEARSAAGDMTTRRYLDARRYQTALDDFKSQLGAAAAFGGDKGVAALRADERGRFKDISNTQYSQLRSRLMEVDKLRGNLTDAELGAASIIQQLPEAAAKYRENLIISPGELAEDLSATFGFELDGDTQKQLSELLSSRAGFSIGQQLVSDQSFTQKISRQIYGAEADPNTTADKLMQELGQLGSRKFAEKYKLDAETVNRLQQARQRQERTGFDSIGTSGFEGSERFRSAGEDAVNTLSGAIQAKRAEDVPKVELTNNAFKISGRLNLEGEIEGEMTVLGADDVPETA